ncbi:MAG: hypothetical protein HZC26_00825, partial [Candidatus Magasanikbacteria bacterium]|nr:hypothetical protein [Candidatus Magasanikbacteria bacterium]
GGGIGATSTFAGGAFFGGSTSNNVFVGSVPGTYPGLWFNTVVPGVTNYAILYDGATTIFNTPAAQKLAWRIGNVDTMKIDSTGQTAMIVAAGYNLGKFYVDSSGNVSASGTTLVFTNSSGVTVSSTAGNLNLSAGVAAGSKLMKFWADGTEVMRLGANPSMTDVQVGVTTNYNAGALSMNYQNGNVSTSGTLRIFGGTNLNPGGLGQNDKFGLAIASVTTAAAGTTAAASTTLTSYVVDGVGSTGFVFNTVIASTGAGMTSTTIDPPDRFLATFQNGGTNAVLITAGGSVYADDSFIANSTYYGLSDVAEYVNLADGETGEPGDVLVVDLANPNKFKKSSSAYSKEIAGVISDTGAFLMGASGKGRVPLGLAGLVRVNASDENGPIAVGDYLVSASKPGYAMKYDSSSGKSAGLVGMALEPLTAGESRIAIMVNKGLVNGGGGSTTLTINEESDGTLTNSLSLNIQNKSLLNVKAINGEDSLWYIDETGLLVAKDIKADSVQAKKFIVKKKSDAKQTSVGEATILNNSTLILVENELVTSTSKIFITFRSNPNAFWWISKQEDGKFEVSLSKLSETDLTFDYWIISTENADEEALVEDVQSVGVVETETPPTEESPSPAPIEEPAAEEPSVEATPEIVTEPETPVIEESAVEQPAEPAPTTEPAPTEPTTVPAEADL